MLSLGHDKAAVLVNPQQLWLPTYIRPAQDQVSQPAAMDEGEAHRAPFLAEEQLAVDNRDLIAFRLVAPGGLPILL